MKVPLSWLADYVDIDISPHELAERMTLAGVEAEEVTVTGDSWDGVVVGLVESVDPHPNADRLRLATVETGEGSETVVCGAPNVAAGQKIAFARVGAELIDGHTGGRMELKPAKIRGVESRGMVCSERELGLSDEHEGILVLPEDAPLGTPLGEYLGETVIDFSPTPNRPDCLSMLGIAREAAALTGKSIREPVLEYAEGGEAAESRSSVQVLDPDLCPRYIAGVVMGVTIEASPAWMQRRLEAAGMRPINNIVDVTNYVMLEFGQPLHAFDYDLLGGNRIVVRRAREGERLTSIDGQSRALEPEMLAIADASVPVAVAGVMGGVDSEVRESTTTILLESACFSSASIRKTSRALGMRTEASLRFEKGLTGDLPMYAAMRAMALIVETAGGSACRGLIDAYPGKAERAPVRLTTARAKKVLGADVSAAEMAQVLGSLGFSAAAEEAAVLATPPYWRSDIEIEDDLIEEVARIKGYDWVPESSSGGDLPAYEPQPMLEMKEALRDALIAAGLQEVINYPLTDPSTRAKTGIDGAEPLRVLYPLSSELVELRQSLRGGLLHTLAANQRQAEGGVLLFEMARAYAPQAEGLPEEREVLAAVLSGPRQEPSWGADVADLDFFDVKGLADALLSALGAQGAYAPSQDPMLHPGRTAEVSVGGTVVGVMGELHPAARKAFDLFQRPAAYVEIDLQKLLASVPEQTRAYAPIHRFPGVHRDMALIVDESVSAGQIESIIAATPLVARVVLFDVYSGDQVPPGKKSLAYRLVYQSPGRTLTNEEAQKAQDRLLQRLSRETGSVLRG